MGEYLVCTRPRHFAEQVEGSGFYQLRQAVRARTEAHETPWRSGGDGGGLMNPGPPLTLLTPRLVTGPINRSARLN